MFKINKTKFGLMLLLLITLIGTAMAGTITAPANGGELCGTYTFTYTTTLSDTKNVTLWRTEANGSTNLWTNVASKGNTSANQSSFTISYSTAGVADGASYKWNLTATDGSGFASNYVNSTSVDNTAPVITYASGSSADSSTIPVIPGEFKVSITTDESLSSAKVTINKKDFSLAGSGTSWSKTFSTADVPQGIYSYVVTAVDDTTCLNSRTSTRHVSLVEYKANPSLAQSTLPIVDTGSPIGNLTSNPIALIAAGLLVYMLFFRKRRGRR